MTEDEWNSWRLVWEDSKQRERVVTFCTEAEAVAFVDRNVDNDPNISSWVIIGERR